jgi:signal transduction histidine kinase
MGLVVLHLPFLVGLMLLTNTMTINQVIVAAIIGAFPFLGIIFRHHSTIAFFIITVGALIIHLAVLPFPSLAWLVIALAVFDVACNLAARPAILCLIAALLLAAAGPVRWIGITSSTGSVWYTVLILGVVTSLGIVVTAYSMGRRNHDVAGARQALWLSEQAAAAARAEESTARQHELEMQVRTSISRELHDIVAHSIAVMVVQAEGGLAQAIQSPTRAQQALANISDTGHEALQEMRRIVRLLRLDPDDPNADVAALESAPKLRDLPGLISNSQATLAVRGRPRTITPTVETTIYRVIQEALTNSLKHGRPESGATVEVAWGKAAINVRITNPTDPESVANNDHRGTGLIGMAERVHSLEGTLTAGPMEAGGFEVCARIPLKS